MISYNKKAPLGSTPYRDNSAHQYPPLEQLLPDIDYALTISPKDIITGDTMRDCVEGFQKDIKPWLQGYYYVLRPELSTKSVNWHYHGTIRFPSYAAITKFYFVGIRHLKSVCTFTVINIDWHAPYDWYLYCVKQRAHMKPYMSMIGLRYKMTSDDDETPRINLKGYKTMDPKPRRDILEMKLRKGAERK